MTYYVKVLTNTKKGFKTVKKFKSYDKAKELFDALCKEKPGAGHFIYQEE